MRKIVIWLDHKEIECFRFLPIHTSLLGAIALGTEIKVCANESEFKTHLVTADYAVVWTFKQEWFALTEKLQRVITPAAGRDYFQVVPPAGVELEYSSFHGQIIAETVVGQMLCEARGLFRAQELIREGRLWDRGAIYAYLKKLRGGRLTILGFGHIGQWIARMAKPFGLSITGIKRNPPPLPAYFTEGDQLGTPADLPTVLPQTDFLVLCLPKDPSTDKLLNHKTIGMLPRGASLYNVGRGNAVDEAALVEALTEGRLAAVYLDVTDPEPPDSFSPLYNCPRCYVTPHAAAFAADYMELFTRELGAKLKTWAAAQAAE